MPRNDIRFIMGAMLSGLAGMCLGVASAAAADLTRSIDVKGAPAQVWAEIGPFCAVAAWHPAIASCATDGGAPPTRTLLTKDGARFVELQTARSDALHSYSYSFTASPLPVTGYTSTLSVTAKGPGLSTVTWRGVYTPNPGKAQDAEGALAGIYESGLAALKAKFAK